MKKITILWIVIMFFLIAALTITGFTIANKKVPYKGLENDIVEGMEVYYGQDTNLKKLPTKKNKMAKITIGELESSGININNIIDGDTCEGYGIVKKETVAYTYKAYIKCDNYTTKGYSK